MTDHATTVLITGASGYLGRLIAAMLLRHEHVRLVLPVRAGHAFGAVRDAIGQELQAWGLPFTPKVAGRIHVVELPAFERLRELDGVIGALGVGEVIHAAGCLDYFDEQMSQAVNVDFTARLLRCARAWGLSRFVYISTAFSSGYVDGLVPEQLHDASSARDPTVYTRTKRDAEKLVAASGLPYLIIRPSIVVGDSRDGHYSGKQYGLYQLWAGIERLLCSAWEPEFHVVAPLQPLNLIHQDAFQLAFEHAWRELPSGSILNLVAQDRCSPTLRELWDLWIEQCFKPHKVFYYDSVEALPVQDIPRRQRALMALASVNLEIGAYAWRFERTCLDAMCARGLAFPDATLESVGRCQEVFMASAPRVQKFMRNILVRANTSRAAEAEQGPV